MLKVRTLHVSYGPLEVLHGVDLDVASHEVVALLGPNGAGKTTLLKTISGLAHAVSGTIELSGDEIAGRAAFRIARLGVALVSESMNLFMQMSVYENLQVAGAANHDPARFSGNLQRVYEMFPRLFDRRTQQAGTMSGGERRMLAIGRALMAEPKLMLIDEPSLGLSPQLSSALFDSIKALPGLGYTVLLVEQNVHAALNVASRAYVLEQGEIILDGPAQELRNSPRIRQAYLGMSL